MRSANIAAAIPDRVTIVDTAAQIEDGPLEILVKPFLIDWLDE
jgi:hypothetical protein